MPPDGVVEAAPLAATWQAASELQFSRQIIGAPRPPLRQPRGIHRRTAGLLARDVSPAPPSRTFIKSSGEKSVGTPLTVAGAATDRREAYPCSLFTLGQDRGTVRDSSFQLRGGLSNIRHFPDTSRRRDAKSGRKAAIRCSAKAGAIDLINSGRTEEVLAVIERSPHQGPELLRAQRTGVAVRLASSAVRHPGHAPGRLSSSAALSRQLGRAGAALPCREWARQRRVAFLRARREQSGV